ncbi:MAG: molybdenum cofactor guanylyltransferase, partial [Balneolaceae bacterium]
MSSDRNLYILCGGQSSRMGKNKALLQPDGKTMLNRLIQRAQPYFNEIVLLSGQNNYPYGLRQLPDAIENSGPLAGLIAAMKDSHSGFLALLPVDLPLISDKTLQLLSVHNPVQKDICIAKSDERIQPLAGIYRKESEPELDVYL